MERKKNFSIKTADILLIGHVTPAGRSEVDSRNEYSEPEMQ